MLTSSLRSVAACSRAAGANGRRYTTVEGEKSGSSFTTSVSTVRYSEMLKIKKARFGQSLSEFKTQYEAPLVSLHAEIRAKKLRASKVLQNRQAMRASRLRQREKKALATERAEDGSKEFKLQEQLQELLQESDLTLAQFMTSGDPRVKEMAQAGNIFENVRSRFEAFEAEAVESDRWWSLGHLTAGSPPDRIHLSAGDRWHWEKSLPESELNKIISSDILSCGLPLREDAKIVANALEELNMADFEAQGHNLSYRPTERTSTHSLIFSTKACLHISSIQAKWFETKVS